MVNEPNPPASLTPPPARRSYLLPAGVALILLALVGGGYFTLRAVPIKSYLGCDPEESEFYPPEDQLPKGFADWEKPLVAIVLSGQMHGYNDPCGCSDPQYGGLTRRFNFIQSLKAKDWDVVGIDMGELPQLKGIHAQNLLKYELSIRALGAMNYKAIGIGRDEILTPATEALVHIWDKKHPFPRPLNLSLAETSLGGEYHKLNVRPFEIIDTTPKIGVISLMGQDLRDDLKPLEKFLSSQVELPKALKAFADAGVEIGIILHHEYPRVDENKFPVGFQRDIEIERKRKELALKCAEFCDAARRKNPKIPPIQLMMVLTEQSEPPALLARLDPKLPTQTIEIGHKGKYVGLIGVYRDGKAYRLQHENVLMSPAWETKKGEEKQNKVIALMENYNDQLKRQDMLAKFPRSLHYNQIPLANQTGLKATYVGTDRCADCHEHAAQVWGQTPHHKATETLEKLKHPSGRQYDPECMMCHTTGFKHPGGYNDLVTELAKWPAKPEQPPGAKKIKDHNDNLRGVGCESCHGPGSEHDKNPNNKDLYGLMNAYSPTPAERLLEDKMALQPLNAADKAKWEQLSQGRMRKMSASLCMKCHDDQNDVNWGRPGHEMFDQWLAKKLIHHTPKNNNGAGKAPPVKKGDLPAIVNDPMPPIVIEIIQDKK
jgi:hypothetical protein